MHQESPPPGPPPSLGKPRQHPATCPPPAHTHPDPPSLNTLVLKLQMQMMDQQLSRMSQDAGFCSRLRFNALPYGLVLFNSGLIWIWLVRREGGNWTGSRACTELLLPTMSRCSALALAARCKASASPCNNVRSVCQGC